LSASKSSKLVMAATSKTVPIAQAWETEVGLKPDPSRFNAFDKTESYWVFADTHNKAVEILTKYIPKFNADYIVNSERSA
jgi:hypothetical protein